MAKPAKHAAKDLLAFNSKYFRLVQEWSQLQLAEQAGISRRLVERIEVGKANPSLENLEKLADAFGVEMADLFAQRAEFTARLNKGR